ncbi:MAG TPA: kelch repeat-containing protein, partial [Candidatus Eisenbacteria bacterium]
MRPFMFLLLVLRLLVTAGVSAADPVVPPPADPAVDGVWNHPELTSYPTPRHRYALVYDSIRHRALLYGGLNAEGNRTFDDVWALDLDEPKGWARVPVRSSDDEGVGRL